MRAQHHAGYVTKLNGMIPGTEWEAQGLDDIMLKAPVGGLFNNAAQSACRALLFDRHRWAARRSRLMHPSITSSPFPVWNHSFFWNSLAPGAGGAPTGPIADAINEAFGSFDTFKVRLSKDDDALGALVCVLMPPPTPPTPPTTPQAKFSEAAVGHFGSGWAWLVKKDGKLAVVGAHDAGNPLRDGTGFPILNCDVWEHSYYIDYRNNRAGYVEAFWSLVNWDFANAQLAKAP